MRAHWHVHWRVLQQTTASYWRIFMGLMTTAMQHGGRALPVSGNMSTVRYGGGVLSGGKWTMCCVNHRAHITSLLQSLPDSDPLLPTHPLHFPSTLKWTVCHPRSTFGFCCFSRPVFHHPPSHPEAGVSAMLSASWHSRCRWQKRRVTLIPLAFYSHLPEAHHRWFTKHDLGFNI